MSERDICRKTVSREILPQRKRSREYNWKKKGYNHTRRPALILKKLSSTGKASESEKA